MEYREYLWFKKSKKSVWHLGRTVLGSMCLLSLLLAMTTAIFLRFDVPVVSAQSDVQTSVTVLNTPPQWTVNAAEQTPSSTSTPTNSGTAVTWTATATDSNSDPYYLLICKTGSAPTANSGSAPTCNGGVTNLWAVSTSTVSGSGATVSTTTTEAMAETNAWFAWICDANASLARCNASSVQGSGASGSPFEVNHRPSFSAIGNTSPVNPGSSITWTATASDSDTSGTSDTVRLFVCRAADFTGTACGAGGTWATSTLNASNPAASTTIAIPTQDRNYAAFVYVIDNHNHAASGGSQAASSGYDVNNVAPSILAGNISLNGGTNISLVTPAGTSGPFTVQVTVVDNNSCLTASSTNEISSLISNVYRSGVGSNSCNEAGEYNANQCYVDASPAFNISCTQSGACSGATDADVVWTCSFDLWYVADPTDGSAASDAPFFAQNWLASVQATDDDTATSTLVEGSTGVEVLRLVAFDVTQSTIAYGSLEPGQTTDPLATSTITDLKSIGNTGLDEELYGGTMCTNFGVLGGPGNPDACDSDGINAANDILIANQRFSTTTVAYSSATPMTSSSSPSTLLLDVSKTTATSTPQSKDTYWGISIPGSITLAGSYTGQNTIIGVQSDGNNW